MKQRQHDKRKGHSKKRQGEGLENKAGGRTERVRETSFRRDVTQTNGSSTLSSLQFTSLVSPKMPCHLSQARRDAAVRFLDAGKPHNSLMPEPPSPPCLQSQQPTLPTARQSARHLDLINYGESVLGMLPCLFNLFYCFFSGISLFRSC